MSTPRRAMHHRRPAARERGAAALLAMMFLVIFGSLATAMAVVAHGNLRTADSHLKLNRALSAADSGMQFIVYHIHEALKANEEFVITEGEIDADLATTLWTKLRADLVTELQGQSHNILEPEVPGNALRIGPIAVGAYSSMTIGSEAISIPAFKVIITPHPIDPNLPEFAGHSYDSPFYDRMPYGVAVTADDFVAKESAGIHRDWVVSESNPLDARWIRVKVIGFDGPRDSDGLPISGAVVRSISMDFRIDKKIRAAVLSKSRVMIGRNVMIEGRIGSLFNEVHLENGHPVQMESDFLGLLDEDTQLDFLSDLNEFDVDHDNRLSITSELPAEAVAAAKALDVDSDGYVSDWDLFFDEFDSNDDHTVSLTELESGGVPTIYGEQLIELVDTFSDSPSGDIDLDDRYAKIRGEVIIKAAQQAWEEGAAYDPDDPDASSYRDYFGGPIVPGLEEAPLTFGAGDENFPAFDQHSFEGTAQELYNEVQTNLYDAAQDGVANGGEWDNSGDHIEAVPFGAAYPYDFYNRQVFRNMTFTNVKIPKGANALFENCVFKGVTFVETTAANLMPHPTLDNANAYNYGGMQEADGSYKHPDIDQEIEDEVKAIDPSATTTKQLGNNLRFHNCRFEGSIISGDASSGTIGAQPEEFSHTRNKLTFTGDTEFPDIMDPTEVTGLTTEERLKLRRGRIITPHFSVEMGTFTNPYSSSETIHLSGTIVAGVLDMRGQVRVDGTILTTFEPVSDTGPVLGDTSPQFNTTLGYFSSEAGDLEAELPPDGVGVIQVRYNPNLPLPDGVRARISVDPIGITYYEGGLAEPEAAD